MKEKAPAFQFYPKDFLSSENTAVMNLEETGAYIRLLGFCWLELSIPDDVARLAKILKVPETKMAEMWPALAPCFTPSGPDRLVNSRLEEERAKQAVHRQKKRSAGRGGARKRWAKKKGDSTAIAEPQHNHSTPIAQPQHNHSTPNATPLANDSSPVLKTGDSGNSASRGRVLGLTAAPEARIRFTATQIEQRRRDALQFLRGGASA